MKFTIITTFAYFLLAFSFFTVFAAPLESRDVFVPPLLYPHHGTMWRVGEDHHVVWNTTGAPVSITNQIGEIFLRKDGVTGNVPLAMDFDILLGRIEVRVPWVASGDGYQVVLIGDSGNFSPNFTICGKTDCPGN